MKRHPSFQNRFRQLGEKFCRLQSDHRQNADDMWIGALARAFTDEELNILSDFLSPNDRRLLKKVRQPLQANANNPNNVIPMKEQSK